eukprot:s194_g38.t1
MSSWTLEYAPGTNPRIQKLEEKDPFKRWKETANKESFEQILLENQTDKELSVSSTHYLKKSLMKLINSTLGLFAESAQRKIDYVHWAENAIDLCRAHAGQSHQSGAATFQQDFGRSQDCDLFGLSTIANHWPCQALCHSSSRRSTRDELQPDQRVSGGRIQERPEDHQVPALQDGVFEEEEEFEVQDRKELAPIKPNYNLRRALQKLPHLVESADNTRALKLLLGLHERMWHTPIADFTNLLRRAGMPTEVLKLAREAVLSCSVCRKYIRLPNRPQMRSRCIANFNDVIQIDLFKFEGSWHMIMIDEATRFKLCDIVEGQEPEQLLQCLLRNWIFMFGPPGKVVMDQQMSLMGHETGAE